MSKARFLADLLASDGEVKVGKVGTAVSNLVDSAPAALNTLNELAAALGDDANFSTTVNNSIALKAPTAGPSFTGELKIAAGTVSVPSLVFTGDTDTGIFNRTANTIGIVTNGIQRIEVDSAGNFISTGKAYLQGALDVTGAVASDGLTTSGELTIDPAVNRKISFKDNGGVFRAGLQAVDTGGQMVGSSAAHDFAIRSQTAMLFSSGGNTERMRISAAGNVGIGTAAPTYTLHAQKSVADFVAKVENDYGTGAGNGLWVDTRWNSSDNVPFKVTTNSGGVNVLKTYGNGTVEIGDKLHVGVSATDSRVTIGSVGTAHTNSSNNIRAATSLMLYNSAGNGHSWENAGAEKMRITSAGDVQMTGGSLVRLTLGNVGTPATNNANWIRGNASNLQYNAASGFHAWEIGGAEKMKLEPNGDMTIGGTVFIDDTKGGTAFNVTGSTTSANLLLPSFTGYGSVNNTYRHCYSMSNADVHEVLFMGGGGNTVFTTYAVIMTGHYRDVSIQTHTLYYSDLKIKIVLDTSNNISVWVAGTTYQNNVYSLNWRVMPKRSNTLTMNPSSSQSAFHHVHSATGGIEHSGNSTCAAGQGPSSW